MIHNLLNTSCRHIETSQFIDSANQLTGFYMMTTLAFNELKCRNGKMIGITVFSESFCKVCSDVVM